MHKYRMTMTVTREFWQPGDERAKRFIEGQLKFLESNGYDLTKPGLIESQIELENELCWFGVPMLGWADVLRIREIKEEADGHARE